MLHKTKGIVFKFIKYRESSIITTVLTESLGIQSYIINSVRTKKPHYSIALFQPLTLLDMVVYYKEGANLNRISEIQCENQFRSIPYDHNKSAIALFLSEVLYKAIKHESHPEGVFQFIHNSILSLDHLETGYENFHLQFLLKLTRYLGFDPESGLELRTQVLNAGEDSSTNIDDLLTENYNLKISGLTSAARSMILDQILDFYRLHIENFGEIHSYRILREVLRN